MCRTAAERLLLKLKSEVCMQLLWGSIMHPCFHDRSFVAFKAAAAAAPRTNSLACHPFCQGLQACVVPALLHFCSCPVVFLDGVAFWLEDKQCSIARA